MKKQLKKLLKNKLTKKQIKLLPSSYDIIGSILIFLDFPKELEIKEKIIGEALLLLHKHIKTVCKKTDKFTGKYRLSKLKIIAGKRKKETTHRENNASLKLHVEKVYFSPRTSTERKRIFTQVKKGEEILVMFSGCGSFSITIAKNTKAKEIWSIEINPIACKYQKENIISNKIQNIKLFCDDVNKILPNKRKKFDRVLMPLPKGGEDFLELAIKKTKPKGIIHFYDFLAKDEFKLAHEKIKLACKKQKKKFKILRTVKCGQFSPRVFRICVDFKIL